MLETVLLLLLSNHGIPPAQAFTVQTIPDGAEVLIVTGDGAFEGISPFTIRLPKVAFRKPMLAYWKTLKYPVRVTVSKEGYQMETHILGVQRSATSGNVDSWGNIHMNSKEWIQIPHDITFKLKEVPHQIVEIEESENGVVVIEADVEDTEIYLGQDLVGMVPSELRLPGGRHTLVAKAEGYLPQEKSIFLLAGSRVRLDFEMHPLKPPTVKPRTIILGEQPGGVENASPPDQPVSDPATEEPVADSDRVEERAEPDQEEPGSPDVGPWVGVVVSDATVRNEPAFASETTRDLREGRLIKVSSCDDTWCLIEEGGYVMKAYLRRATPEEAKDIRDAPLVSQPR